MPNPIVLPPEWQTVPLACPKCAASVRARFNPNTGTIETLRCTRCPWTQDCVEQARLRKLRLAKLRRSTLRTSDRQTRFT